MFKGIKETLKEWVKNKLDLYDIEDLQVGGHCGLCGKWTPRAITVKGCGWGLCEECEKDV